MLTLSGVRRSWTEEITWWVGWVEVGREGGWVGVSEGERVGGREGNTTESIILHEKAKTVHLPLGRTQT